MNKQLVEITKKGAGQIHTGQGDTYPQGAILEIGVHILPESYDGLIDAGWINDARPGDQVTYKPKPAGLTENDRLAGVVTKGLIDEHNRRAAEIAEIPEDVLAKARELMAAEAKTAKAPKAKD